MSGTVTPIRPLSEKLACSTDLIQLGTLCNSVNQIKETAVHFSDLPQHAEAVSKICKAVIEIGAAHKMICDQIRNELT